MVAARPEAYLVISTRQPIRRQASALYAVTLRPAININGLYREMFPVQSHVASRV